ncbi:hypothetical protein BGX28_008063 [Mortierella sp. GBA30]|nr:hypothetical protein BGX28_008063 [Mortierella sp. GBA30]
MALFSLKLQDLILPLLFYRSIGSLATVSIISVLTLPPILLIVGIRGFAYAPDHKRSYDFVGDNVFPAIGVMAFAMLSAQSAFLNFATLARPTRKAWGQATGIAVSLSWLVSFVFAVLGFIAFGDDIQPNIFNSFPLTDGLINAGRGLLGFSMYLTFPQAFYPARDAVHKVLGHEDSSRIPSDQQHIYTTIGLFIPILICGVFISNLGLLYQLIGGFCSTFLAYIIPGLCYILVFWRQDSFVGGVQGSQLSFSNSPSAEGDEEHGQGRYEDDGDSSEEVGEDQLLKQKLSAENRKSDPRSEEVPAVVAATEPLKKNRTHVSYGATSSPSHSSSSSSGTLLSLPDLEVISSRHQSRGGRKTELWLDIGAGVLVIFGVFVMVISTTMTLRKMAGV